MLHANDTFTKTTLRRTGSRLHRRRRHTTVAGTPKAAARAFSSQRVRTKSPQTGERKRHAYDRSEGDILTTGDLGTGMLR